MSRCPICRKPAAPRGENDAFPFCSRRCRLVDLGNWLGEHYRVPVEDSETAEDSPPAPSSSDEETGKA